jgi:hypothetical protein
MEGYTEVTRADGSIEWVIDNIDEVLEKAKLEAEEVGIDETAPELTEEEVKAWKDSQYQRDRQYPPIEDQLDMIYHAGLGGDEFQATIKAVKDKYPKGA